MSPLDRLIEALFGIYTQAGTQVTYITDRGERRPYWANRYRQALQRSVENGEVIEFVERLVMQNDPSRGFFYLKDADRLDLSVEALVVEQFPELFDAKVVAFAEKRLREHGYTPKQKEPVTPADATAGPVSLTDALKNHAGETFDAKVTVGADGALTVRII